MRAHAPVLLFLVLTACRNDPDKPDTQPLPDDTAGWTEDVDGDGYDSNDDCDDEDASIHPGADETCDGLDNDCDGDIDEDAIDMETWYADADGDGFGDPGAASVACEAPDGFVLDDTDCDDADAEVHPGAPERCDGIDNDCDGAIDEELHEIWYADADGDGYGNADNELLSCDPDDGWVIDDTDCDDANSSVNPGAKEVCNDIDDDCDGDVDEDLEANWYQDADGDGHGDPSTEIFDCEPGASWVENAEDCDDANSDIHPDAQEECNGYDDDCDGLIDDEDDSVVGLETYYLDADADGYGEDASSTQACEQPSGYAAYGGDCDDTDAAYNPGASEDDCTDPNDYNCDGSTGYADDDGDGWAACEDCDDSDADVNPDATELCNGVDDDCDGDVDEDDASDATTWYQDADGDGFGDLSSTTTACDQPSGYVSLTYATDCDDTDATISPVAAESCNGVDDDCDGDVDEGVMDTFFLDADADGYGEAASTTEACDVPSGYSADDTDCDDTDAAINPSADELCNGVDDDCDGTVDETDAVDAPTWYRDHDGDGYGDASASTIACDQPTGYVADDADCDDLDDDIFPGAEEHCDGVDEDCDGDVDEEAVDGDTFYADADGDGYGDAATTTTDCSAPTGYVADDTDCDDTNASVSPAATETCDGIDNDCDGLVDDDDPSVTGTSTWYLDYDGDGYGGALLNTDACEQPSNYVADSSDCDDSDATANPGATESCDGVDNDCDGDVDEGFDADTDGTADCFDTEECDGIDNDGDGDVDEGFDSDADGTADCFDTEECDGVDNDGDGLVDDDDPGVTGTSTWYVDYDGDGYGGAGLSRDACDQPSNYVADDTDCDDGDASAYPGADELCDGTDNDCDGEVDEDDAIDASTFYADSDGDGYGDASSTDDACSAPSGYVSDDSDCDDGDSAVNPGATEACDGVDNDCDGSTDEGFDSDADGTADCYDVEECDGVDNDGDGDVDEDEAIDASTWYADADGDGYGDAATTTAACDQPSGYTSDTSDCDDDNDTVYPGASEACDGLDNDCDGDVDEGAMNSWYADADGDGFGDASSSAEACSAPSGYVADADDCDDADSAVNPDADEACDGLDNDCDGVVDEDDAIDADTWYLDHDSDGYGTTAYTTAACDQPSGYVADDTDCNDWDADDYPGADETCDGVDNDCDGDVDEADAVDPATWYIDDDGDGYGLSSTTTEACDQPSGYASSDLDEDCDDTDASINPGAEDVCDGVDQDCDGDVDDDAHAGKVMITVDTNHGYAYEIDTETAGSAALAALDSGYKINSVAVDLDGWAVGNDYDADTLVDIDPCTGAISTIGSTGVSNSCGISFGPGGLLYGMDNGSDELVWFDTTTAVATTIGSMGYNVTNCGMAYDCTNDVLYGATSNGDVIFKIDASTGAAYDIVYSSVPFSAVGIEYDPASGLIYASTGADLYTVDPADGSTAFVGPLGGSNVDDLVHYPECE